ncbi:MAG: TIGR01777 family oxidoreductase [Bacteroidota bacterium]|nr:TIGR01777 family oxidoreductase [Bacteroidota bacterium]
MNKKIVITGATGLIGKRLIPLLKSRNDEVIVFTRSVEKAQSEAPQADKYVNFDYSTPGEWQNTIDGSNIIIHLAGANIAAKRWSLEYKKVIYDSRINSTKALVDAMKKARNRPELFICASASGYYGDRGHESLKEDSSAGNDFLANLCIDWEKEAAKVEDLSIRRISLRTGVVLSKDEGALKRMLTPYKFYVGGPIGTGKQYFPWIHIQDYLNIILFCIDNPTISGPVNAAAPETVSMYKFADILGLVIEKPSMFEVPKLFLKIALGEIADSLVASQRVIPKKLKDAGFEFKYPNADRALRNLLPEP